MLTNDHVVQGIVSENGPHQFSTYASDLMSVFDGFGPGNWPGELQTTLGNGRPFRVTMNRVLDGDLVFVKYQQDEGCLTLTVYND
jgi:hypothetical protein